MLPLHDASDVFVNYFVPLGMLDAFFTSSSLDFIFNAVEDLLPVVLVHNDALIVKTSFSKYLDSSV